MSELINLNTASQDDLISLPGVGPAIAERIGAARPFGVLDDLLEVEGIGPAFVERISPLVSLESDEPAPDAEPVSEGESVSDQESLETDLVDESEEVIPEDGLSHEDAPDAEAAIPEFVEPKELPKVKTVTRVQAWGMSILCSLIAFILALVLSLGILGGINGGLRYVRPGQLSEYNRQIEILGEQIGVLAHDLEGLRERLSNLEGVGERVDQIDEDITIVLEQSEFLLDEMNDLRSEAVEFEYFLDGLRELLGAIQHPENP